MMGDISEFNGFSNKTIQFYSDLEHNNNKIWFEAHKTDFEHYVMDPAKDFVVSMGEPLKTIAPKVHADPRVNKSNFRIYRDTRFSKHDAQSDNPDHLVEWSHYQV